MYKTHILRQKACIRTYSHLGIAQRITDVELGKPSTDVYILSMTHVDEELASIILSKIVKISIVVFSYQILLFEESNKFVIFSIRNTKWTICAFKFVLQV